MSICLGYDSKNLQDGAGAQVQRLLAVESLSCFLNVGYYHQEILSIDSNYGDGINDLHSKQQFINNLNGYLNFSNFSCHHVRHTSIKFELWPRFERFFMPILYLLKFCLSKRGRNYLLIISNPYPGIRGRGDIYNLVRSRHGISKTNLSKKFYVKIHLPWANIGAGQLADRKISLRWYQVILQQLNTQLTELGFECTFTFHTDGIQGLKSDLLSLGVSQKTQEYWSENNLLADGTLNWSYIDIESEFNFLPNMNIKYNISPIEVWDDMVQGDVLILAKSSLSFVAGLLNINALKLLPVTVKDFPKDFKVVSVDDPSFAKNLNGILADYLN
jgi:hypothetical protein